MTHKKQTNVGGSLERGYFLNQPVEKRSAKKGLGMQLSWQKAYLAGMKPWVRSPALHQPAAIAHKGNSNAGREVEAGRADVQGHPWVQSELEASLGYMKFCERKNEGGWGVEMIEGKKKENQASRILCKFFRLDGPECSLFFQPLHLGVVWPALVKGQMRQAEA